MHIVCDNYATHKTDEITTWLTRHPRFHIHFTPTGSSWVNQVERFFGLITDRLIRRGVHTSVQALEPTSANGSTPGTTQVLAGLLERLCPGETRLLPSMQLGKIGRRPATLYDGSRSRPIVVIGHTMIMVGRSPTRSPDTPDPKITNQLSAAALLADAVHCPRVNV